MFKKHVAVLFLLLIFTIAPRKAFATLYINEFSSSGDSDWIEIYNSDSSSQPISGYKLKDEKGNTQLLPDTIPANGFVTVDWSNRLDKDGDKIQLLKPDDSKVDEVVYGVPGDVGAPEGSHTAGRNPDGTSNWVLFESGSKGSTNNSSQIITPTPTPTPQATNTPTPTKTPTPAPSSTPTKAPTSISAPTSKAATPTTKVNNATPTDDPNSDLKLATSDDNNVFGDGSPTPTAGEGEVLGMSTISSTPIMFIVLGLIILGVCGILAYFQFGEKIFIWKKRKPL